MSTTGWIVLVVLVVLVVIAVLLIRSRQRSAALRQRFGPEYDRTVETAGGRRPAERDLAEREKLHDQVTLRPLPPGARERYAAEWTRVQQNFVDAPNAAVTEADRLVTTVMAERGYPVEDERARQAVLSVEHADAMDRYRSAHEVSQLNLRGEATTEQLRQAMLHYRALADELLGESAPERPA